MGRFIGKAILYHSEAHASTPANLAAAVVSMTINNMMFLHGIWLMLFAGKPGNQELLPYFLALWACTSTVWGLINFFTGGLASLGQMIEESTLEPMLATPRHPLWSVAIASSHAPALGDILQGLATFGAVAYVADVGFMARALAMTGFVYLAFLGVFILAGSLAFYLPRGGALATFLNESTLTLTTYPIQYLFQGRARLLIYLTPALFTAVLPMAAVQQLTWRTATTAAGGAAVFFLGSLWVFNRGVRRYRSGNWLTMAR